MRICWAMRAFMASSRPFAGCQHHEQRHERRPPEVFQDRSGWSIVGVFGFVWLAAMSAGVLYAFAKARPIAASLESLEDQAEHFAEGRGITNLPDSRVEEVNRALTALERASGLLQSAMRQRDRSLETEREARAVAEARDRKSVVYGKSVD